MSASGSSGGKRKRVVLTLKDKLAIVTRLENGESRQKLMQEYNIGSSTLYDLKASKEKLQRYVTSAETTTTQEKR